MQTSPRTHHPVMSVIPIFTFADPVRFGEIASTHMDMKYQHMTYEHGWGLSHEPRLASMGYFGIEPPHPLGKSLHSPRSTLGKL